VLVEGAPTNLRNNPRFVRAVITAAASAGLSVQPSSEVKASSEVLCQALPDRHLRDSENTLAGALVHDNNSGLHVYMNAL
jgi:hypothetical protein